MDTPLLVACITLGAAFCAWIVRQMIEHARVFGEVRTELANHRDDLGGHEQRISRLEHERRWPTGDQL